MDVRGPWLGLFGFNGRLWGALMNVALRVEKKGMEVEILWRVLRVWEGRGGLRIW